MHMRMHMHMHMHMQVLGREDEENLVCVECKETLFFSGASVGGPIGGSGCTASLCLRHVKMQLPGASSLRVIWYRCTDVELNAACERVAARLTAFHHLPSPSITFQRS